MNFIPPISLVLAATRKSYVAGFGDFSRGDVSSWCDLFAAATNRSAVEAEKMAAQIEDLQSVWLGRLGSPRSDAAVHRLSAQLPAQPVMDVASGQRLTGKSREAVRNALAQLEKAGIMRPLNQRKWGRVWECRELLELIEDFEESARHFLSAPDVRPTAGRVVRDRLIKVSLLVTERGREVARLSPSGPADSPLARLVTDRGATMPRADLLSLARGAEASPAVGPPASRSSTNCGGAVVACRLAYLDSSAYVKLPLREAEHGALLEELARWDGYVSSALLAVEAIRACGRYGSEYAIQARSWLEGLALLPLDDAVLYVATSLEPVGLRSLEALHLATALSIREEVGVLITYDQRLALAADEMGLKVVQPAELSGGCHAAGA